MEVELQDNLTDDVKSENIEEKNEMKIEEENYLIEDDNLLEDEEQIESLMVIEESNESIKETLEEMNVKEQNIKTEVENKEIIMDVADIKSESIDILKHIDENFIEKEESISNDKISVNDIKKNHKRKQIDAGWSSDEDFFGFTETGKSEITSGLLKKIKSESMSDEFESQESGLKDEEEVFDEQVLAPIMPVTGTPKSEKRTVRAVPLSDPIYRKPFEYGWKRELVLRANPDPSKEKGEVYYITPSGKKLRTRTEIQMNLHDGLILTNFTLTKEALGADPQDEIIRSAKISTTSSRRSQQVEQVQPQVNTSIPLGKRIPKPKQPKGSSPTPPSFIRSTPKTIRTNNTPTVKKSDTKDIGKISDSDSKLNIITPIKTNKPGGGGGKPTPKTTKGEPCTIQCVLAMGTIPQLQCCLCLCLYHHECVGMEKFDGPLSNYTCENCKAELSTQEPSQPIQQPLQTDIQMPLKTQTPPPINKLKLSTNSTMTSTIQPSSSSIFSTSAGSVNQNINPPPHVRRQSKETHLVNSMTAWHPSSSTITNRNTHHNSLSSSPATSTPPQTIAIVNGKKFIVVPKMNVLSVSPSGEPKNSDRGKYGGNLNDNNGPYNRMDHTGNGGNSGGSSSGSGGGGHKHHRNDGTNVSASTSTLTSMSSSSSITAGTLAPIPLMTGDASPVQKRRLTGKQNSGKFSNDLITTSTTVQTPIASPIQQTDNLSPTIGRITSPFNNNNKLNNNLKSRKNFGPNMGMGDVSFSTNFFTNVSIGYDVLLHTFQYLKVQELLRASCVCRLWNQAGNHVNLWKTVRMKNSQVNDWDGMANTLIKNGTKHLDLKKMLGPKNSDESWEKFSKIIGNVQNLESIDLCKCSVHVVEKLFESNQNLKIINAVTLKEEEINLGKLSNLKNLTELRIKSSTGLNINNLISIKDLVQIRHLSLTSVRSLGLTSIEIIGNLINLESLELGECCDFELNFVDNVLPKLINLERLRLEKGQDNCCTFDILTGISKMVNLIQLELINFDIRNNFDDHLSNCKNIKKLLMIPTYVKQSATTNQIVLNGVMKLHETLTNFTWAVTGELVRVTELYVDTCDSSNKKLNKKTLSDCIPVLKPVPGILENTQIMSKRVKSDVPQVEILPLSSVEKILNAALPDTKVKMVIIPYHATWRQNLVEPN